MKVQGKDIVVGPSMCVCVCVLLLLREMHIAPRHHILIVRIFIELMSTDWLVDWPLHCSQPASLFWGAALLLLLALHSPSINLFGSWSDHEVVGGSLQLIGAREEVVDDVPHLGNVWSLVSGVHLVSRSGT